MALTKAPNLIVPVILFVICRSLIPDAKITRCHRCNETIIHVNTTKPQDVDSPHVDEPGGEACKKKNEDDEGVTFEPTQLRCDYQLKGGKAHTNH